VASRAAGHAVVLAGLALALHGCAWGPGARIKDPVLASREIRQQVRGNTLVATAESGAELHIHYLRDGRVVLRGRNRAGVTSVDTGRWSVEDDRLCTRYEAIRGGEKICEWVTYEGGVFRTYDPLGRPSARGRLYEGVPAQPERLPPLPPAGPGGRG